MRRRIDKRFNPSTLQPEDLAASNKAQATIPASAKYDEKAELEQVNVLYSFLENRYAKKVCIYQTKIGFTATMANGSILVSSYRSGAETCFETDVLSGFVNGV